MTDEPFTIIDTGSSHIFVPPEVFTPLVLETMKQAGGPEYLIQQGIVIVDCTALGDFKPIQMMYKN